MTISIIIPSYNGKQLLEKNFPSVVTALKTFKAHGNTGEIIVSDDASNDETISWLKEQYSNARVLTHEKNVRFAESCNDGVAEAKGDIIVLLNNDVRPNPDFLYPLIKNFNDPNVFAVGCKELNIVDKKTIEGGRGVSAFKRGLVVHWRPKNQESPHATWVSGGSAAFKRELWNKLGGFDTLFYPAYEEDRDLCWRALKAGYKVQFEQKSVVVHHHETTNTSVFGGMNMARYSMKNQLLFVWKNISSTTLLIQHLLWLPYHLVVTSIRTRGIFLQALFLALFQLPEAMASRKQSKKQWRKTDEEILSPISS